MRRQQLGPRPTIGHGPAGLLDALPGPLAEMVAVVQTALEHMDMAGSGRVDPLSGCGIDPVAGRGRLVSARPV